MFKKLLKKMGYQKIADDQTVVPKSFMEFASGISHVNYEFHLHFLVHGNDLMTLSQYMDVIDEKPVQEENIIKLEAYRYR